MRTIVSTSMNWTLPSIQTGISAKYESISITGATLGTQLKACSMLPTLLANIPSPPSCHLRISWCVNSRLREHPFPANLPSNWDSLLPVLWAINLKRGDPDLLPCSGRQPLASVLLVDLGLHIDPQYHWQIFVLVDMPIRSRFMDGSHWTSILSLTLSTGSLLPSIGLMYSQEITMLLRLSPQEYSLWVYKATLSTVRGLEILPPSGIRVYLWYLNRTSCVNLPWWFLELHNRTAHYLVHSLESSMHLSGICKTCIFPSTPQSNS